jgi:hypothetical protein
MRFRLSRLILLFIFAVPCLAQNANVSVSATSPVSYDRRPFGKYLVETCTITGEQLTVTCTKFAYPPDKLEHPNTHCPQAQGPNCPGMKSIAHLKDQNITIKLVCDPTSKAPCDPTSPKVGEDFFVSATADSGLPVQQKILLGSSTPLGGYRTVHYRANAVGPLVIRATTRGCGSPSPVGQVCGYAEATPVDLVLQVGGDSDKSDSCVVLPPSAGSQIKPLDAPTIVSLLGNPTPFIVAAEGPNTIFIYATRLPLRNDEPTILGSFQQAIAELAGRNAGSLGITLAPAKPFIVELKIPHASALGDIATRIGALNYSQFTVQDVTRNSVRITAPTQPDCETWKGFLTDIRGMTWQLVSAPTSEKLFYLSSSDVATAFSGLASPSATAPPAASSTPSSPSSSTPAAGTAASPAAPSSTATIAIAQPPGSAIQISSDTTPCVVAGLAFGNPTACGSALGASSAVTSSTPSAAPTSPTASAPPTPLAMASVAVAAGTGEQTPPDLLVYSDTNPGDDSQIMERNRILALLDLPRPEMILSAWVTQNSSTNSQAMGAFNNMVKSIVANYDDEYDKVVLRAWLSLKQQQKNDRHYFNEPFRSYISDRFVADTSKERKPGATVAELSQAFLDQSQAKLADPISPVKRQDFGICERGRYCLGYTGLFSRSFLDINSSFLTDETAEVAPSGVSPIKPSLTDLLLAIIAAQKPIEVADQAIRAVQGEAEPVPADAHEDYFCENLRPVNLIASTENDKKDEERYRNEETRKRCHAIWRNLDLDHVSLPPQGPSCENLDFRGILGSLLWNPPNLTPEQKAQQAQRDQKAQQALDRNYNEPRIHLECFKQAVDLRLASACESKVIECKIPDLWLLIPEIRLNKSNNRLELVSPTRSSAASSSNASSIGQAPYSDLGVGLFRAAIADFLFNYKMSQQYPHEFVSYDLTQSANALNNALNPLIDAFNRDLESYQIFVRADMQYQVEKLNARNDDRCCVKRIFGLDKPSFFNDGLVTVRTISGQPTSVSTTSQSFFNASTAPELSALLSSLSGSGGSAAGSTTGGTSPTNLPPGIGGNFALIAAALANYQSSFAQIGRQLSFTATPRSLATASSAEIAVVLNADESAGGPLYTGPGANDPAFNTSRVANHDTTTRVRVDSIKLFEVSSFSAIVERSRSRFPLLPPFVEIPYIGTFAGIPLGSAKEFHSSTAIVSAYVVPTAADIAYGLHFVSDLVADGLNPGPCSFFKGSAGPDVSNACLFRRIYSLQDVGEQQPIREFNKNITRCFATDTTADGCRRVSFDNALEYR